MARRTTLLLFISCLLWQSVGWAQPQKAVDSLLEVTEASADRPESVISLLSQSLLRSGEPRDRARIHDRIAAAFKQLALFDSASVHAWHVLRLAPDDNVLRSRAYALLGFVAFHAEAWNRGAEFYGNAVRLSAVLGDKPGLLEALTYLARINLKLQFTEEALRTYERAKVISTELRDAMAERQLLFEMAGAYRVLGRFTDAEDNLNRSLTLYAGDSVQLARVHTELGKLFTERVNYRSSLLHFKQALELTRATDPLPSYLELSAAYTHLHSMDTAVLYADSAEAVASLSDDLWQQRDFYDLRYRLAETMKDTAQAYAFLLKFHEVDDSVKSLDSEKRIRNVRHELFLGASEASVRTAELESLLRETTERSSRNQRTLALLATGLGVSAAILLAAWYFTWRRARERMAGQESETRDLRAKNSTVFAVMANDLQGPIATFDNLTRSMPSLLKAAQPEEVKSLIKNLHISAQELQQSLHELLDWAVTQSGSLSFRPEVFSCLKLAEQVLEELRPWAEEHGVKTTLLIPEGVTTFADRAMIKIVLRTLLFNGIRYSTEGETVTVFSGRKEDLITMGVKDHGQVPDGESLQELLSWGQPGADEEKSVGLPMCSELVRRNQGALYAEANAGQGRTFYFTLPEHPPMNGQF